MFRMRYPAEQKSQNHDRIVDAAARSFRECGSAGQGIANLMKDLGLTHGGFYKHFESKEDLYAAAIQKGFEQSGDRMVAVAQAAPKGQQLRAIIEDYLSVEHLELVGDGCTLAALAPEIGRQPALVRSRINGAMRAYMNRVLPFLPGRTAAEKRKQFFVLIPSMAGVLMTARAMADQSVREEILAAARTFYTEAFTKKAT